MVVIYNNKSCYFLLIIKLFDFFGIKKMNEKYLL